MTHDRDAWDTAVNVTTILLERERIPRKQAGSFALPDDRAPLIRQGDWRDASNSKPSKHRHAGTNTHQAVEYGKNRTYTVGLARQSHMHAKRRN